MTNEKGETFFIGKDVAKALGYSDVRKAIRVHVDSDDRGVDEMATPGGIQKVVIINESGLYSLILSSKLEQAKAFKRWVTSEVLAGMGIQHRQGGSKKGGGAGMLSAEEYEYYDCGAFATSRQSDCCGDTGQEESEKGEDDGSNI